MRKILKPAWIEKYTEIYRCSGWKGIVKEGVLNVGKNAGTITNPVGNFAVGAAAAIGTIAVAKGLSDKKNKNDNKSWEEVE